MAFTIDPYEACGFCAYLAGEREFAVVLDNDLALAFVNRRQYERGGMLVIPKAHRETILDLESGEIEAVYALVGRLAKAVEAALPAAGLSVFQNNGLKSGQHMPHFHVHVVPRYAHSDPKTLFLEENFEPVALDEQRTVAEMIRSAL